MVCIYCLHAFRVLKFLASHEHCYCMFFLGLSLPLTEHEVIKDCVNVYCEWLTALYQVPRISVPRPICEDPNLYARKIINHFHKLFVPRQGEGKPCIDINRNIMKICFQLQCIRIFFAVNMKFQLVLKLKCICFNIQSLRNASLDSRLFHFF